ncbi:ABC transporter ATP-binding protein [uncultured Agrococcus sp.]|uniref:ABC transporter ATP-binding protein n=1 Tax=uncultured Agrococcus sp. TaxID=382258 RepID=UPI0025CC115B|nr:ABC transporter ATP-binding protein [uncultured Agrococcus sp.]
MTTLLEVEGIDFSYRRGNSILRDVRESFPAGEVVALTGPSGRGKSTLLYILGLLMVPNAGNVRVLGEDLAKASDVKRAKSRAHMYGFVFQDAALDLTRTVLDNVLESTLYRGERRRDLENRARELLDQFEVSVRIHHKPGEISGGQAQRIAVCRALLGNPRILLADEPTGNLDAVSSRIVIDAMRHQADHGSAVVIATHDPSVMAACDRRVEL